MSIKLTDKGTNKKKLTLSLSAQTAKMQKLLQRFVKHRTGQNVSQLPEAELLIMVETLIFSYINECANHEAEAETYIEQQAAANQKKKEHEFDNDVEEAPPK